MKSVLEARSDEDTAIAGAGFIPYLRTRKSAWDLTAAEVTRLSAAYEKLRALAMEPDILFADEPTGNHHARPGSRERASRVGEIRDGRVTSDDRN